MPSPRVAELSDAVGRALTDAPAHGPRATDDLEQARWRVLRAETSCNFY
jgi:hypothetical protein